MQREVRPSVTDMCEFISSKRISCKEDLFKLSVFASDYYFFLGLETKLYPKMNQAKQLNIISYTP